MTQLIGGNSLYNDKNEIMAQLINRNSLYKEDAKSKSGSLRVHRMNSQLQVKANRSTNEER